MRRTSPWFFLAAPVLALCAAQAACGSDSTEPEVSTPDAAAPDATPLADGGGPGLGVDGASLPDAPDPPPVVDAGPPWDFEAGAGVTILAGQAGAVGEIDGLAAEARLDLRAFASDGTDILAWNARSIGKITNGQLTTLTVPIGGSPTSMAYANGKYYVAKNHIDTVDPTTGQRTRVAGGNGGAKDGVGTAASFGTTLRLAYDGGTFLYVADLDNAAIRRVNIQTTEVVTIAGAFGVREYTDGALATARFRFPRHIAYFANALYVTDDTALGFHRLRKIDLATSTVETTTNVLPATNIDVTALGSDAAGLYSAHGWSIYRLLPGAPTLIAGGTRGLVDGTGPAARVWDVGQITPGAAGNLLLGDGAATVRRLELATGQVSTLVGTLPSERWGGDGIGAAAATVRVAGATTDAHGKVYFTDWGAARSLDVLTGEIKTLAGRIGVAGTPIDGVGAAANMTDASGIAWTPGGLYVIDASGLRHIDLATSKVSTITLTPALVLAFGEGHPIVRDGNVLYMLDAGAKRIARIDLATKAVSTLLALPDALTPFQTMARSGNDLVLGGWGCDLARVSLTTKQLVSIVSTCGTDDGPLASATVRRWTKPLCADLDHTVYVVEPDAVSTQYGGTLRRMDTKAGTFTTLAGSPLGGQRGLRVGPLASARFNRPSACVAVGLDKFIVFDEAAAVLVAGY